MLEHTAEKCRIAFLLLDRNGDTKDTLGTFEYTIDDAKKAGLAGKKNWQQPKPMLFARCIGQGYRTHCPDALDLLCYAEGELEEPEEKDATPEPPRMIEGGKRGIGAPGKTVAPIAEGGAGCPSKSGMVRVSVIGEARLDSAKVVDVVGTPRPTTPASSPGPAAASGPEAAAPTGGAPGDVPDRDVKPHNPLSDAARAEGPPVGVTPAAGATPEPASASPGEAAPRRRARRD